MSLSIPSAQPPAKKEGSALLPAKIRPAVVTIGAFAVLLVVVQLVNMMTSYGLVQFGIESRDLSGLVGVLAAPLIHASWGHLVSNLVPLLVFGVLLMVGGAKQFVAVTVLVWLISGIGVWLVGPSNTVTVGASGLVFGWLAYLVARGVFTRNFGQIAIGIVLLAIWGGIFWSGIVSTAWMDLTGNTGVSWQAHLFGALAGVLAAFLVARADKPSSAKPAPALPA